jgi:predicted Zn-dependent protease
MRREDEMSTNRIPSERHVNRVKLWILGVVAAMLSLGLSGCDTVPVTGRSQLSLISASELNSMSFTSYKEFLSAHKLSTNMTQTQRVKRAGQRIQGAVTRYLTQQGLASRLQGYHWEFNLVEDPEMNAWCMPGGKVVVYTGILPVAKDEAGLAVVMGHEIAHAVANHGNERMSQGLLLQMGGMALSEALVQQPAATKDLFLSAFGVGSQVGFLLPYSRLQESEADRLGLIFMAMAGYDPRVAVPFWQRMRQAQKGQAPPEFLSSHPADDTRIQNLNGYMAEAMRYYKPTK